MCVWRILSILSQETSVLQKPSSLGAIYGGVNWLLQ